MLTSTEAIMGKSADRATPAGSGATRNEQTQSAVLPVRAEQFSVQTERVAVGAVRVRIEAEATQQPVEAQERVEQALVQRVPRDVEVSESRPPWTEGETLVVPVYAQHLEVRRKLVLREEIRIVRRVLVQPVSSPVVLRSERAVIERQQADGSWHEIEVESPEVATAGNPSSSERNEP